MIVLLGGTGYIGEAFARELREGGWEFSSLSRKEIDYTRFDLLLDYLRRTKPEFLINAAGYTGRPNVDACEVARAETLQGNTLFPQTVAHACELARVPWGHVSSGCIYSGAWIVENGQRRMEKDLIQPEVQRLLRENPDAIQGFKETDPPNFTFRDPPCSFYSGTKALAEEALANAPDCYIWRLRIPFDEYDNPRNYLTKIQRYEKVYDNVNSLSHRGDFVRACLELWKRQAPFGTYNLTNPGFVTTRQVVRMVQEILRPQVQFEYWGSDAEFYKLGAKTPRSNCVLDVTKSSHAGVQMRPVTAALNASLSDWILA